MGQRQTSKEVLVRIRYKVENPEAIKGHQRQLKKLQKQEQDGTIITEKQTKAGLQRTTMQRTTNQQGIKQYSVQQDLIKQGPKFKMEYLGIMFAGMALNRATQSLTQTSKEWLGMQEMLSLTSGLVMLPAMTDLTDIMYPLLDIFMGLPEPVQKLIGYLTAGAGGVGAAAMTFGQLMLAVNSISIAKAATGSTSLSGYFSTVKNDIMGATSKYRKFAKLAGKTLVVGATVAMAVDDLSEGNVTAAVGDMLMGIGFIKGGKLGTWSLAVGFTMKFVGDKEFQEQVYSVFWTILDKTFWFGEAIAKAVSGRFKDIDWTFFDSLADSSSDALIKLEQEGKLTSDTLSAMGKDFTTTKFKSEVDEVTESFEDGTISVEEYGGAINDLKDQFPKVTLEIQNSLKAFKNFNDEMSKYTNLGQRSISTSITELESSPNFSGNYKLEKSFAVGTQRVPRTGLAMVHEGEQILRKDQAGQANGQTINISYTINATNMREVESMLRESERRVTSDIRRLSI